MSHRRGKLMAGNYGNTIRDNESGERREKEEGFLSRNSRNNTNRIGGIGGCTSFNCLEATSGRAARHVAPQPILGSDFCATAFLLVEEQKAGDHADPTATVLSSKHASIEQFQIFLPENSLEKQMSFDYDRHQPFSSSYF